MQVKRTQGDREFIEFWDWYANACQLQVASTDAHRVILLRRVGFPGLALEEKTVRSLVNHLQAWLDSGTFSIALRWQFWMNWREVARQAIYLILFLVAIAVGGG